MRGLDDSSRRVSDLEREQTVLSLRDDLLAGRLTLEEFSERVEVAYSAQVGQDLVRAREDLPEPPAGSVAASRRRRRLTAAFFGHIVRRGRLRMPRRALVVSAFGDVDLDLREALVDAPRLALTVFVLVGNIDVYVPDGLNVEVNGAIVFGRQREWGRDIARADAPTIHVRVVGLVGTVDVWRVPHELQGSYGEIIEQLEEGQRLLPGGSGGASGQRTR